MLAPRARALLMPDVDLMHACMQAAAGLLRLPLIRLGVFCVSEIWSGCTARGA